MIKTKYALILSILLLFCGAIGNAQTITCLSAAANTLNVANTGSGELVTANLTVSNIGATFGEDTEVDFTLRFYGDLGTVVDLALPDYPDAVIEPITNTQSLSFSIGASALNTSDEGTFNIIVNLSTTGASSCLGFFLEDAVISTNGTPNVPCSVQVTQDVYQSNCPVATPQDCGSINVATDLGSDELPFIILDQLDQSNTVAPPLSAEIVLVTTSAVDPNLIFCNGPDCAVEVTGNTTTITVNNPLQNQNLVRIFFQFSNGGGSSYCWTADFQSITYFFDDGTSCVIDDINSGGNDDPNCLPFPENNCGSINVNYVPGTPDLSYVTLVSFDQEPSGNIPLQAEILLDVSSEVDLNGVFCSTSDCSVTIEDELIRVVVLNPSLNAEIARIFFPFPDGGSQTHCWSADVLSVTYTYATGNNCTFDNLGTVGNDEADCTPFPPNECGEVDGYLSLAPPNSYVTLIASDQDPNAAPPTLAEVFITLSPSIDPNSVYCIEPGCDIFVEDGGIRILINNPAVNQEIVRINFSLSDENGMLDCWFIVFESITYYYAQGEPCEITGIDSFGNYDNLFSGQVSLANCASTSLTGFISPIVEVNGSFFPTNNSGDYIADFDGQASAIIKVDPSSLTSSISLTRVTTADITIISRHILGFEEFELPWQFQAANVSFATLSGSQEQSVNINDIIAVRRLLLGLETEYPEHPNTAWYATVVGEQDESDNFAMTLETELTGPTCGEIMVDFQAIELGNVTDGCTSEDAESSHPITLTLTNHPLKKGESYKIPISIQNFDRLSVLDFAFSYDNKAIKLNTISSGDLVMQDDVTHNINQEAGTIRGIWLPESMEVANARPTDPNQFYVEFTALENVSSLAQVFELEEGATNNRIYPLAPSQAEEKKAENFKSASGLSRINWINVSNSTVTTVGAETPLRLLSPNPFTHQLDFSITSPAAQSGNLQLFSLTGQRVAEQTVRLEAGDNRLRLTKLGDLASGTYVYRLVTERGVITSGKVVKR